MSFYFFFISQKRKSAKKPCKKDCNKIAKEPAEARRSPQKNLENDLIKNPQ